MTREEAIKIWCGTTYRSHSPGDMIDVFVDLGILKLEESKSVLRRAEQALRIAIQVGSPDDPMDAMDVIGCLDDAGLKIVEK